jgi:CheY-like chemotaxis protein
VLHVEDSDEDAALIQHLLKSYKFRLSRVRTYGELMDFQGHPDVVLLDLRIPGSNDPLRLVSDCVRRFRTSGIILLTGITDDEGEELSVRAMAAGAQVRLVKGTFDRRRLWLSIREAFQQRQHMIRTIEESRSDMRVDPEALRDVIRNVMDQDLGTRFQKIEEASNKVMRRLRKLGAEDTEPHDVVLDHNVEYRIMHGVWAWFKRHDKLVRWIITGIVALYFAASDYVTGVYDAVIETRDTVKRIDERLQDQ